MDTESFQRQLREQGEYHTPADAQRGLHRLMGWSDVWYYLHILRIVGEGSRYSRRGRYPRPVWSLSSYRAIQAAERCGGQVHILGANALARTGGPAVIIANHMSMAETFILPCVVMAYGEVSFVVKESLLRYPLFGTLLRGCHPISVSRQDARQDLKDVLGQGQAALAAGRSVVVFPQATRQSCFVPKNFNSLGVKLAARAGVPVVPLALKTDFQSNGRWIKEVGPLNRRLPLRFHFADPMDPRGAEKSAHAAVVAWIRDRLTAWGGEVREETAVA